MSLDWPSVGAIFWHKETTDMVRIEGKVYDAITQKPLLEFYQYNTSRTFVIDLGTFIDMYSDDPYEDNYR